jgi:hypothetical protein
MTPEELDEKLRAAKGPSGGPFDVETFKNFKNGTRYRDVLDEIANREISLQYTWEGRPGLFRTSIWMYIYYRGLWLTEMYRVRQGEKLKPRRYGQAGTETLMRGENVDQGRPWRAAKRGFHQEFQLEVEREHLDFNLLLRDFQRIIIRESTVYPGFVSGTLVYPAVLDLTQLGYRVRPWKDGRMVWDTPNKVIRCEWKRWKSFKQLKQRNAALQNVDPVMVEVRKLYGDQDFEGELVIPKP